MLCVKELKDKGINEICDLLDGTHLYDYQTLQKTFQTKIDFVTYGGLIQAIPVRWKQMLKDLLPNILDNDFETNFEKC